MRVNQLIQRLWPLLIFVTMAACNASSTTNPVTIGKTSGVSDITSGGSGSGASGSGDGSNNSGNGSADSGDFDTETGNSGFGPDINVPPGTENPTPSSPITRFEPESASNGYVTSVEYDSTTDSFSVDNIAFDGAGPYSRDGQVGGNNAIIPYAVYESAATTTDAITGTPIDQLGYKAIYAVSASNQSKFGIVRTGAYQNFGFGGFLYNRSGSFSLPSGGQATFTGNYQGLRDFDGDTGIEYAVAQMTIDIDFDDFNDGSAVKGELSNRKVFDSAGNDITTDVLTALNNQNNTSAAALPVLTINITSGSVSANGELIGTMQSLVENDAGIVSTYETGNYYAVMSGDQANEVVGVLVVTADDPRFSNVTVRETGGFILTR